MRIPESLSKTGAIGCTTISILSCASLFSKEKMPSLGPKAKDKASSFLTAGSSASLLWRYRDPVCESQHFPFRGLLKNHRFLPNRDVSGKLTNKERCNWLPSSLKQLSLPSEVIWRRKTEMGNLGPIALRHWVSPVLPRSSGSRPISSISTPR